MGVQATAVRMRSPIAIKAVCTVKATSQVKVAAPRPSRVVAGYLLLAEILTGAGSTCRSAASTPLGRTR